MDSKKEEMDSNNNSPRQLQPPSIKILPSTPTALTPKKLPSTPCLTPKRKIFPPVVTPISPQLIRNRNTSKAAEKLMKSVTENRLLNEVIALKGELNETKLRLEDYQAENTQLKNGNSELQKKNHELNDEINDVKTKLQQNQAEIFQLREESSEHHKKNEGEVNHMRTKLEDYQSENSQLKKRTQELNEEVNILKKNEGEINDMRTKLEGYQAENSQSKKKTQELNDEVNILKKKSQEFQRENSELKKEIEELKKEIEEFRIRVAKKAPNLKEVTVTETKASKLRAQASFKRKTNSNK